ncbi:MAG: DEAD/DEAH box helicase family protein [Ignavibacteriales bacterium]|nr:DEAD/DEAH box helicase family protein [Ignavibacteriales bacterium]
MFELKDFQRIAVDNLSKSFLNLWSTGNYQLELVFKAPTGSGKTVMMAEFLRCLDDNYEFHTDKAYLWLSFGGDTSYLQSKNKLYSYFNEGTDMSLKDLNNLSEGKLYKNNIFFINWSKIKASNKEGRILRKPNEYTEGDFGIFDEFIQRTKEERDLCLIIDEAHIESGAHLPLYNEIISLVNPRIIIKVTATPTSLPSLDDMQDKKAGYVSVKEEDVIESGLIKKKIVIQTEEDILNLSNKNLSTDELLLELAINKRYELKKHYESLELDINPLVMIQLPSDYQDKEEVQTNLKSVVLQYLNKKGVKDNEIAIWLSEDKTNLEKDLIVQNNNEVNFLLFKVAPATGWDCPRADILVMYREISSPIFHAQVLGRIKRMPEGHHYNIEELNYAYLFTNYSRDDIKNVKESDNPNKEPIFFPKLKDSIVSFQLESTIHHRTNFNTLTPENEWQSLCKKNFDNQFETTYDIFNFDKNYDIVSKKLDLKVKEIHRNIIVNAEITSFDNFIPELKDKVKDIDYHLSRFDIERLYNFLCFKELADQTIEEAKYNPSRSWSPLKKAINVWFKTRLNLEYDDVYPIIVNELLNTNSNLKQAINSSLIKFRPIFKSHTEEKEPNEKKNVTVPELNPNFTIDYELKQSIRPQDFGELSGNAIIINNNVYDEFYLLKNYTGRQNECRFIHFLESQNIDWWHKQNNLGADVFSVEYLDSTKKILRLFYPDFIIKKSNKIFILDTKAGMTISSPETKNKAESLQEWIKQNKKKYPFEIIGGIAQYQHPNWLINSKPKYNHTTTSDWDILSFK